MIRRSFMVIVLSICAAATTAFLASSPSDPAMASASQALRTDVAEDWTAAAPGIVEPHAGFLRLGFADVGRIAEILVRAGDAVRADDMLVRLVDTEQAARTAAAEAELAFRVADLDATAGRSGRNDPVRLTADAADAERTLAKAQADLDAATAAPAGSRERDLAALGEAVTAAGAAVQDRQEALRIAKATAATRASPDRKSAAVDAARADLALARAEEDKLVIRAPVAGTVLDIAGKVGELVSVEPVVTMGEVGAPSIRVELDEADAGKVHISDEAVVRNDGNGTEIGRGLVVEVAPLIKRRESNAVGKGSTPLTNIQEVRVEFGASTAPLPGTRVDVFFRSSGTRKVGALW